MEILVVDDHLLFLQSFSAMLQQISFVECVYCCNDYDGVQNVFDKKTPDIVFLDLNLNNARFDGFRICAELRQLYDAVGIIIITSYNNVSFIKEAEQLGANAYFTKETDTEVLEDFLRGYNKGGTRGFFCPCLPPVPATNPHFGPDAFEIREKLSKAESKVFDMIARGSEHDEIQSALHISYSTVRTHRDKILQKLKLKNVLELVRFAIKNNLVD